MPSGLDGNPAPVRSAVRDAVLSAVAAEILALAPARRIAIGIDGAPGTGKSTFADELAVRVRDAGRPVVRSTTDSFHRPRAERYRRGRTSPEGYYLDSHDLDAIRGMLLDPFAGGAPIRTAAFDEPSDRPITAPLESPPADAVLLFDGLFLHREELADAWDSSILLLAPKRVERAHADVAARLTPERFEGYLRRYAGGWRLYEERRDPAARAGLVIDNDDFAAPASVRASGRGPGPR